MTVDAGRLLMALVDPPDQLDRLGAIGRLAPLVGLRRWLDARPDHDLARLDDADLLTACDRLAVLAAGRRVVLASPTDLVHLGVEHRLVDVLDNAAADRDAHQLAPGAYAIHPPAITLESSMNRVRTVRSSPEALDAKARLVVSRPAAWPAHDPDSEPTYVGAARTCVEAGLVVAHPVTGGPTLAVDAPGWSDPLGDDGEVIQRALDLLGVDRHDPVRQALYDSAPTPTYRDSVDGATARRPVAPWSWLPAARWHGIKLVQTRTGYEERGSVGTPGSYLEALGDMIERARATLPSPPPGDAEACFYCGCNVAPAIRWVVDTHGRARCHQEDCTRGQHPTLHERAGVVRRLLVWAPGVTADDQFVSAQGLHQCGGFDWWGERDPRPPATRKPWGWVDQAEIDKLTIKLNDRQAFAADPDAWLARRQAEADERARQAEIDERVAVALAATSKETP